MTLKDKVQLFHIWLIDQESKLNSRDRIYDDRHSWYYRGTTDIMRFISQKFQEGFEEELE